MHTLPGKLDLVCPGPFGRRAPLSRLRPISPETRPLYQLIKTRRRGRLDAREKFAVLAQGRVASYCPQRSLAPLTGGLGTGLPGAASPTQLRPPFLPTFAGLPGTEAFRAPTRCSTRDFAGAIGGHLPCPAARLPR